MTGRLHRAADAAGAWALCVLAGALVGTITAWYHVPVILGGLAALAVGYLIAGHELPERYDSTPVIDAIPPERLRSFLTEPIDAGPCPSRLVRDDGVEYWCGRLRGHVGPHEVLRITWRTGQGQRP